MASEKVVACGWLSRNGLDRHRPVFMAMHWMLFAIWSFVWVDVSSGGSSFSPDTWGSTAYAIPAWFWSAVGMCASAMVINGLIRPVRSNMILIGSIVSSVQFSVLAYSAALDGGVFVVGLFASNVFLPFNMWLIAGCLQSARIRF